MASRPAAFFVSISVASDSAWEEISIFCSHCCTASGIGVRVTCRGRNGSFVSVDSDSCSFCSPPLEEALSVPLDLDVDVERALWLEVEPLLEAPDFFPLGRTVVPVAWLLSVRV